MAESDHPLLLDLSIFLGEEGFDWLVTSPDIDRSQFVVPRNFFDQVARRAEYRQSDQELWGPLPDGQSRRDLEELIAGFRMFAEQNAAGDLPLEAIDVLRRLRDLGSQTAIEEWLFLQTNSWLAARTRTRPGPLQAGWRSRGRDGWQRGRRPGTACGRTSATDDPRDPYARVENSCGHQCRRGRRDCGTGSDRIGARCPRSDRGVPDPALPAADASSDCSAARPSRPRLIPDRSGRQQVRSTGKHRVGRFAPAFP